MIKTKQLDEIRGLSKKMAAQGDGEAPSLERHVMIALVSGEAPKLKPVGEICETARKRIISGRYGGRELAFGDVFASCNGYEAEMRRWKAYEAQRNKAVDRFNREAEKILVRALDPEADAGDVIEQLHAAASKSGLTGLTAPSFEKK